MTEIVFPLNINVINYVNKLPRADLVKRKKKTLEVLNYSYSGWLDLLIINIFAFIHKWDLSVT